MSTTEKILKALWSPRDTAVQALVDLGQSLKEQMDDLRASQQEAYNNGQNLKGFAMNAPIGAASLAKSTAESAAEGIASLEIGGGSTKVDEKGGLAGLYNTTSRVNAHDPIKLPEPTKKSAAEMESGDKGNAVNLKPHKEGMKGLLQVAGRQQDQEIAASTSTSTSTPTPGNT